jgi:1-carboxybiuret hydrolase
VKTPAGAMIGSDADGIAAAIRARTASATEICETALAAAAAAPGIFWTLDSERARADAGRVDAVVAGGAIDRLGPLAGVPVAVKDNFDVLGLPTRLGCPRWSTWPTPTPTRSARCAARGRS